MSERENLQVVREAYGAFSRGEAEAVLANFAEDISWEPPAIPGISISSRRSGREQVAEHLREIAAQEEITRFEPQKYVAQGDTVVALIDFKSTVRATGRNFSGTLVHVFTMLDGKVSRFQEFYDTAAAMEAFGIERSANSAAAK